MSIKLSSILANFERDECLKTTAKQDGEISGRCDSLNEKDYRKFWHVERFEYPSHCMFFRSKGQKSNHEIEFFEV